MANTLDHSAFSECTCRNAGTDRATLATSAAAMARVVQRWNQRSRQRTVLRKLDAAQLRDMGISREDALREAAKPFWS